jgi:hypothetical protein
VLPRHRAICAGLWLSLAAACGAAAAQGCPTFALAEVTGYLPDTLAEISGMVASRDHPGVFWAHNDSGDSPRIFAISATGAILGVYTLNGATLVDWEDITLVPREDPLPDLILIGDIGDNTRVRPSLTIYQVEEPVISVEDSGVTGELESTSFPIRYPNAPGTVYDCETLLYDPVDGSIYLVTKQVSGQDTVYLFRAAALQVGETTVLEARGSIVLGSNELTRVTGGDVSPAGAQVLLRQYGTVRYWRRGLHETLSDAMLRQSCNIDRQLENQSESICFDPNGLDFYTASERLVANTAERIRLHRRTSGDGDPEPEGEAPPGHSADIDGSGALELGEVLRVVQLFHGSAYYCQSGTEDGFGITESGRHCAPHSADYAPQDWIISLSEVLRAIQLFSFGGFHPCEDESSEDGFCPDTE